MAPALKELTTKVDLLLSIVKGFQKDRQEDSERLAKRKSEQNEAYIKRIRVHESRLSEPDDSPISRENHFSTPDLSESILETLVHFGPKLFKGSEDPLTHIQAFEERMLINRAPPEQWPTTFPHSLGPAPAAWFHSQTEGVDISWEEITTAFVAQYHTKVHTSIRALGAVIQGEKESFTNFVVRGEALSAQLTSKPEEHEIVMKLIDNLRSPFYEKLRYANISTFNQLRQMGLKIENDIQYEDLINARPHKLLGSTSKVVSHTSSKANIDALKVPQVPKKPSRVFTPLDKSYTDIFNRFEALGFLSSIGPTPDPQIKPYYWKEDEYCEYHDGRGHTTENCFRLRYKIQDLIDSGTIPLPTTSQKDPNDICRSYQ